MHASLVARAAAEGAPAVTLDGTIQIAGNALDVHSRSDYAFARGAAVRAAGTGAGNLLRPVLEHCADGMVVAPCGGVGYEDKAVSTAGCYTTSIHTSRSRTTLQEAPKDPDESKQARGDDASATSDPPEATAEVVNAADTSINAYPDQPAGARAGEAQAGARGEGAGHGRAGNLGTLPAAREARLRALLDATNNADSLEARDAAEAELMAVVAGWHTAYKAEKAKLDSQVEDGRSKCAALQAMIDNGAGLTPAEVANLQSELAAAKRSELAAAKRSALDNQLAAALSADQLCELRDRLQQLRARYDHLGIENHGLLAQLLSQ